MTLEVTPTTTSAAGDHANTFEVSEVRLRSSKSGAPCADRDDGKYCGSSKISVGDLPSPRQTMTVARRTLLTNVCVVFRSPKRPTKVWALASGANDSGNPRKASPSP